MLYILNYCTRGDKCFSSFSWAEVSGSNPNRNAPVAQLEKKFFLALSGAGEGKVDRRDFDHVIF